MGVTMIQTARVHANSMVTRSAIGVQLRRLGQVRAPAGVRASGEINLLSRSLFRDPPLLERTRRARATLERTAWVRARRVVVY